MNDVQKREKEVQEIIDHLSDDGINKALHELFEIYDMLEADEFETVEHVKNHVERVIDTVLMAVE